MGFDYEIRYVKGNTIPHVDAMSRLDFNEAGDDDDNQAVDSSFVHWTETDVVNMEEMAIATKHDPVLSSIVKRIATNRWSGCSIAERPCTCKAVRHRLTVEQGVVFNGDLIIPAKTMRHRIIQAVHDDVHCGMAATKQRLRLEAWWPGFYSEVERYIRKCEKCTQIKQSSPRKGIDGQQKKKLGHGCIWITATCKE